MSPSPSLRRSLLRVAVLTPVILLVLLLLFPGKIGDPRRSGAPAVTDSGLGDPEEDRLAGAEHEAIQETGSVLPDRSEPVGPRAGGAAEEPAETPIRPSPEGAPEPGAKPGAASPGAPAAKGAAPGNLVLDSPLIEAYDYLPLPKPGTPTAALAEDIMRAVRATGAGSKRRLLATLKVRLDYALYMHQVVDEEDLARFRGKLRAIEKGEDVLDEPYGGPRGYYAANDDSCQPYRVSVPYGLTSEGQGRHPLVVSLHHHGWSDWCRPFQGYATTLRGAITIAPHGRGSCDYLWIAEDDVLACMDAALADYPIDPKRVYVTGWSMGGTGAFHLPGRYPHRFAASFPKAGNADFTAWEEAWKEDRRRMSSPLLDERMFLRWETAPVTYAENFLHVPISIDHGALDSINPVGHSRSMAGRLKQLDYKHVQFRAGEGGHSWGSTTSDRFEWMRQFRIDPRPNRVRFKTGNYRHSTAYWLTIDRLARRMVLAEVDIKVSSPRRVEVATAENVSRFTLTLAGLGLAEDDDVEIRFAGLDEPVRLPRPLPNKVALGQIDGGSWAIVNPDAATKAGRRWPPPKRLGLEGPIEDAFRDPFLVVIGTSARDPFERGIVRAEAGRWLRQWRRRFQAVPPVKFDTDVVRADIENKNLILFGGPSQNTIVERISARLPVRIEGSEVVAGQRRYKGEGLGLKLVYPNPENPSRSVVVFGATGWQGMWQVSHRFGTWFDWMPLDNRQWFDYCVYDDQTRGFETFLDAGFFDEDWAFEHAVRFFGLAEWRARTPPRNYPRLRQVPDGLPEVRLSDLWPEQIDTAREPLRIDRSLNGKPLCIGHAPQKSGLGQWIESAVTYNLRGKARRFRTNFGIDAEGQEKISDARRYVEYTEFIVMGDGETLARKRDIQFGDPVQTFDIDVTGVERLTLMALRSMAQGWLYGPVCWGEPVLVLAEEAGKNRE